MRNILSFHIVAVILFSSCVISCNKLVSVDEPIDTITAAKMFQTEPQAEGALTGIYNGMIHGKLSYTTNALSAFTESFAAGLTTYAGGLSAGEFYSGSNLSSPDGALGANRITLLTDQYPQNFWNSAYYTIYNANSVIEGIVASTSSKLRDSVRKQYTGEAKFLRAFSYFYLVNYFGDVPLALTVDFNKTSFVRRSPVTEVYAQILKDLKEAENDLPAGYAAGNGLRVRVNKWAAKAMLAKVYLFTGDNANAAAKATEVISQSALYQLEPLNNVFLSSSREAVFQLMQTNQDAGMGNATAEGCFFIPLPPYNGNSGVRLSNELLAVFEPGDQRKKAWTDSTLQDIPPNGSNVKVWYPSKYKTGLYNTMGGAPSNEFYMVLRLAEMYLIRAEARSNGVDGGAPKAIEDLNELRFRASLTDLPLTLDLTAVKEAIARERQIELFAEWGNRWMDLKRTGKASAVLSAISAKQPWEGDYQLLYPIPASEIRINSNLQQNPGYNR